jgi:hypothetical protein
MIRCLLGALVGVACTAALLYGTRLALAWATYPDFYKVDHWVIYLTVVLGAGFGSLSAAFLGREQKS